MCVRGREESLEGRRARTHGHCPSHPLPVSTEKGRETGRHAEISSPPPPSHLSTHHRDRQGGMGRQKRQLQQSGRRQAQQHRHGRGGMHRCSAQRLGAEAQGEGHGKRKRKAGMAFNGPRPPPLPSPPSVTHPTVPSLACLPVAHVFCPACMLSSLSVNAKGRPQKCTVTQHANTCHSTRHHVTVTSFFRVRAEGKVKPPVRRKNCCCLPCPCCCCFDVLPFSATCLQILLFCNVCLSPPMPMFCCTVCLPLLSTFLSCPCPVLPTRDE